MPSPDKPEKRGNEQPYPQDASFAKLLDWHLDFGTRPTGSPEQPGQRWINVEFSKEVGTNERSVRNWRAGRVLPSALGSVEFVLFGNNPAYNTWRFDLRAAYDGRQPVLEIPPPPPEFLGREADVTAILGALLSPPAVNAILVQGPPGIGKSALTKAVANHKDVIERFGEANRWFIQLETATTAALMQDAITRTLGGDPQSGFKATLALLRQRPGLVVLDNLETPWDPKAERHATEETIASVASVPGVAVLASFRGLDRVGGPRWTLVHSVDRIMSPFDGELFCRIAHEKFEGDAHLPLFLSALEGIPLAIELVAWRAYGTTSLADLWRQWTKIGSDLCSHPDFAADRLNSLPHSIELSLKSSRMTEASYRLFCLLGQLPAGIVADDRDELLGAGGFNGQDALRRIGLAVERGARLDLLSPIRDHARRHHIPQPSDHLKWPSRYLDLARRLGKRIGMNDGAGVVTRLQPEFANISAAISAALSARPSRRGEVMAALEGFSWLACIAALPAPILNELAEVCRMDDDLLGEASCIHALGDIARMRSDYVAAGRAFEEALPLYRKVRSVRGEASCIWSLGDIAIARSNHTVAREAFENALQLYRKVGYVRGAANCIKRLGDIELARSGHSAARKGYKNALLLFRKIGDVLGAASCIKSLGDIARTRFDHTTARKAYKDALLLYSKIGNVRGEADCIKGLGEIALARSNHDVARKAFEDALLLYRKVGNVAGEANCSRGLGDIALRRFDVAAALKFYEDALALYHQVGDLRGEADCISSFGDIALARSDHAAADKAYGDAFALYVKVGDVVGEVNCISSFGDVALARSDYAAAHKAYEDALPRYREFGSMLGEANCIKGLGDIALARFDYAVARKTYKDVLPLYRKVGSMRGEANCIKGLGDIALARSDNAAARKAYEDALVLYRKLGNVRGEASCIEKLKKLHER